MFYQKLNKPEYWFRPRQIFRKLEYVCGWYASIDTVNLRLPWGTVLQVNPHETIGKNMVVLGVYELAVSEILWRLTVSGDWCLDVGANIGYMTSLLAAKTQAGGKVFSFEPHPVIFGRLQENIKNMPHDRYAPIQAHPIALGASEGKISLVEPEGFNSNEGNAKLTNNLLSSKKAYQVDISRLDSLFFKNERFGVVKVDVEGWELSVFQGAEQLLDEHRIRDIVFEDFDTFPSDTVQFLQNKGYAIFRIAKKILGPFIAHPLEKKAQDLLLPYEPVNYLATIDPQRALKLLQPRGWFCLKAKIHPSECEL
jgi:FkbM family methyltransferase